MRRLKEVTFGKDVPEGFQDSVSYRMRWEGVGMIPTPKLASVCPGYGEGEPVA